MKLHTEPGFQHTENEPRFFVLRFGPSDPEFLEGYRFEVQFLDSRGNAGAYVLLTETDIAQSVDFDLPDGVVAAAKRQALGSGDYVDFLGQSKQPF